MAVHFLHTSDWHLGQFFHHHDRDYEHTQFLKWLIEQIKEKQPNALLIAGDIFDVINPASSAQKQLYQFLSDAHDIAPHMQTLMIAGNHDSGYRIEQVAPLLEKYNAKAVGVIQRTPEGTLDVDQLLVPIFDQEKNIVAWCLTLPFLRNAEITGLQYESNAHQTAIAAIHSQLINEAKKRKTADQALILMSHAHMQGGETSDSERPIVIGHEEALSTALFDEIIDYVALGHLHKPQKVGQDHIRYSGSPIPLSFSERNYKHQILDIHLDPKQSNTQRFQFSVLEIPRLVDVIKIKTTLTQLFDQLAKLDSTEIENISQRHFLEIEYTTDAPPPLDLRQRIDIALPSNRYRLLRVARVHEKSLSETVFESKIDLEPPTPERLFEQLWQKAGYQLDPEVRQDFMQLLIEAQHDLELKQN